MSGMRRSGGLALALALAGCLKPSAHQCSEGWTCPSGLECAAAPAFCGTAAQVTACSGKADYSTCSTATVSDGFCQGGACQPCVVDEAACPAHMWTPMTYAGDDLTSVFVRAPDSAIAVGGMTIADWDGHSWTAHATGTADVLSDVWVPPEGGDAWIVSPAAISRWDGSALTTENTQTASLTGVWASSQTDIYAVGSSSTIVHGTGKGGMFTPTQLMNLRTLQAVGGSSASDVYVVGSAATLAHLEAGMWVAKTLPADVTGLLAAVWADAPNDVFVVGNNSVILHFDGTAWTHSPATGVGTWSLRGVWGSGPNDVYAVGADTTVTSGVILHFDGTSWTTMLMPAVPLVSISGSGAHEVIAVGANKTVLRYTP